MSRVCDGSWTMMLLPELRISRCSRSSSVLTMAMKPGDKGGDGGQGGRTGGSGVAYWTGGDAGGAEGGVHAASTPAAPHVARHSSANVSRSDGSVHATPLRSS
eukprot:6579460-Prymnesium_polylepis.1